MKPYESEFNYESDVFFLSRSEADMSRRILIMNLRIYKWIEETINEIVFKTLNFGQIMLRFVSYEFGPPRKRRSGAKY